MEVFVSIYRNGWGVAVKKGKGHEESEKKERRNKKRIDLSNFIMY